MKKSVIRPGLCGVVLFVMGALADEQEMVAVEVPLSVDEMSGLEVRAGRIGLSRRVSLQEDSRPYVCVEAEYYSDVFWQEVDQSHTQSERIMDEILARGSREAFKDSTASGGEYMERMSSAAWTIGVKVPGEYVIWNRIFLPFQSGWAYESGIRPALKEKFFIRMPRGSRSYGEWFWEKVGIVKIDKPGGQRITVSKVHNGHRLDKIVLHRDLDWVPSGEGPDASPPARRFDRGQVQFKPVDPGTASIWKKVVFPDDISADTDVSVDVKWGEASPWSALRGGDLDSPKGASAAQVRLNIALTGDGVLDVPVPRILLDVPRAEFPELSSQSVRYVFNANSGALFSVDLLGEKPMRVLYPDFNTEVFSVYLKRDNGMTTGGVLLDSKDFEMKASHVDINSIRFSFSAMDYPVGVELEYCLNSEGYLDASISVKNDSELDILEVEFPRLSNVRAGEASQNDILIWPDGTGRKYYEPSAKSELVANYPQAVMPWCALYDQHGGLYFGAHDPNLISMEMRAVPDVSRSWVGLQINKRDCILKNGGTATYRFAIGGFSGDWHTAAPWYRNWYETRFPKPDWPEWVKESNGWLFENIRNYHYEDLKETVFARAVTLGIPHVQMWATDTALSCPRYFYPPDMAGGPDAMRAANTWWREQGGQVGYYFLPHAATWLFSDESDTYYGTPWSEMPDWAVPPGKKEGASWDWLVKHARYESPDRSPPAINEALAEKQRKEIAAPNYKFSPDTYPWFQFTPLSFYSDEAREWIESWISRYRDEFNCSTIYLDTFHHQGYFPDYNPFLGLHGGGKGGLLRSEMARRILEEGREKDPDWFPIMERECDAYMPWMATLIGASAVDSEFVKFTLPWFLYYEGQTGTGWGPKRFKRFNSGWMYGSFLDHREYEGWATEILFMRRWITRWVNEARFLDDCGLRISSPELRGKLHRVDLADGSRGFLALFWNTERREWYAENETLTSRDWTDYEVTIDLGPMASVDQTGTSPEDWIPRQAVLVDMGGMPLDIPFDVTTRDGRPHVTFKLPPRQVNGVLFVCKAAGPRTLLANWDQQDFSRMNVHLFNPGTKPIKGSASVSSAGIEFDGDTTRTSLIAPGELVTLSFPYKNGEPPVTPQIVNIDLTANDTARNLFAGAYPFADNASFEDASTVLNITAETAFDGRQSLLVEKSETLRFRLEPQTRYRMTMQMKSVVGTQRPVVRIDPPLRQDAAVPGKTLRFVLRPEINEQDWTEVSFCFLTPEFYHDGWLQIMADKLYFDAWKIETLPADAEVEYLPDTEVE
jgi:hypothetical protein